MNIKFSSLFSLKKSKDVLSDDDFIRNFTAILFKLTAIIYAVWGSIAFYVRPYGITLKDLILHISFILAAVFTATCYYMVKIILPNPVNPLFAYREKLRPIMATATMVITFICMMIFINYLPNYKGKYVASSQDTINVSPTPVPMETSPTSQGTPIPSQTPAPDTSPTPSVSESPLPTGQGYIKIQQYNVSPNVADRKTVSSFRIVNIGKTLLSLEDVKVRYYFSSSTDTGYMYSIDYAPRGINNVIGTFFKLNRSKEYFFELSFKKDAGTLRPNRYTEVRVTLDNTNWRKGDFLDDYSFNAKAKDFETTQLCIGYVSGKKVWGQEPSKKTTR